MTDIRTDCIGQPVEVGDLVAYTPPYEQDIVLGEVVRLTPQNYKVKRLNDPNASPCTRPASRVIKVSEQYNHHVQTNPELII